MGRLHCLVLLLSLYSSEAASEGGKHWCYLSQMCHDPACEEPRAWNLLDSECGKNRQSPINIITSKVQYNWELGPFSFKNYDTEQEKNWTIKNNGHSVQVMLDGSATVASGGLSGTYKAVQFHFHWGNNESRGTGTTVSSGSEHSIDGERYAMELHIVHIKNEHASLDEALLKKGVAVLGFFIELGEENQNYNPLISNFKHIPYEDNATWMAPLPLGSLIPKKDDLTKYYRYTGSLTTPLCNEDVEWTLFQKPIQLALDQIQEFWMKLYFGKTKQWAMVDNFRPVQPVNGRIVYKSESNALLSPAKALLLIPMVTSLALALIQ
ncbi:carbonic anhydrase 4 [Tiliqua scincoides]|uniref:carbonic anhydrase 4 n=1 Tax=Tiliqua scincoides TaxID=71010 RepID=UPI003461EC6B